MMPDYEALALGRIPVFVDPDCILPFHDRIDWRSYAVWVDARDIRSVPHIVAELHARVELDEGSRR
jgi:hypothetical protein